MKIYASLSDVALAEIVRALNADGLVIFPTDTVYGIAGNALSDVAVRKLYAAKQRSRTKPIGILVSTDEQIDRVAAHVNATERNLMAKYWPGNLTLILDKRPEISEILTAGQPTIGVRVPNHPIAQRILAAVPYPLATSSANLAGEPVGTRIEDFAKDFADTVEIAVDGGTIDNLPSTIVRVEGDEIRVLRQGSLKI